MFRTRDFMLVFVAVVFLLVAISATLMSKFSGSRATTSIDFSPTDEVAYSAEVINPEVVSREDRISTMREKIAAGQALSLATPAPTPEVEVDETLLAVTTSDDTTKPEVLVTGVQQCANYSVYAGNWMPQGLSFDVAEGARLVYREGTDLDSIGLPIKEVLLQLPIYAVPSKNKITCLPSDVVGIAQDGSLIRNNEAGLYRVFGAGTLVGYALDGFPIYGATDTVTDTCGGVIEAGQYRYYLSSARDTVINCFVANPVSL